MKLKFKRDETSIVPPGKDQVDIGEIVINSVTGRLYTKTIAGEIVEFIGQKLCFNTVPEIKFYYEEADVGDNVGSFCCSGGLIIAEINKLKPDPSQYSFDIVELTNNTIADNISLDTPRYRSYTDTVPADGDTPATETELRQATVPVTIKVNPASYENISIFKFVVYLDNIKLVEKLLTLTCLESI